MVSLLYFPVCAPAKPGYTLKANTEYLAGPGTAEGQIPQFEEAVSACDHTSNCVALNSYGYYVFGNRSVVAYQPRSGLCVYVKDEGKSCHKTCRSILVYLRILQ
jgi:hypothetical protein